MTLLALACGAMRDTTGQPPGLAKVIRLNVDRGPCTSPTGTFAADARAAYDMLELEPGEALRIRSCGKK